MGVRDTRGTLFFEVEKILKTKQPYSFLLENVKQLVTIDNGDTFKTMLTSSTNWDITHTGKC
jgi:DNA (cytosine-5)-methyltransferase 1